MGKKGAPLKTKNENKEWYQSPIYYDKRVRDWFEHHREYSISRLAYELLVKFIDSSEAEVFDLNNRIKELENKLKEMDKKLESINKQEEEITRNYQKQIEEINKEKEETKKEREDIAIQIQSLKNLLNQKIKEKEEKERKEKDDLYFAVFMLRKGIHNGVKSSMKLQKKEFFNSLGIEFNYDQFIKDFHRDYGEILKLSEDEMIQKYNVKFDKSKVKDETIYNSFRKEYENGKNKGSSEKSSSESKVENKTATTNTVNNLSVNSIKNFEIVCIIRTKIENDIRKSKSKGWLKDLLTNNERFNLYSKQFNELGIEADFRKMFSDVVNDYENFQTMPVEDFISKYQIMFSGKINSIQEFEMLKEGCQQKSKNIQETTFIESRSIQGGDQ